MQARPFRIAAGVDDIEAAGHLVQAVAVQEQRRGAHQPAALVAVHRGGAPAEGIVGTEADLDEHQQFPECIAVLHHQVELTATVVRVGGELGQSCALQQIACSDFDGVPAGAEHVRYSANRIGTYGLSPVLVPWLFAGTGNGPQTDIEVSRNVSTAGPLRIGAWDVGDTGRTDFRILGNWTDVEATGPVMEFDGVNGLEVRDTTQPLAFGRLARVTDSRVIGEVD